MMFMIVYNPRNPESGEENTKNLDAAITDLSRGRRSGGFFNNFWLAQINNDAPKIRNLLRPHLKPGDRIFVARIAQNWAGLNMGEKFPNWMNDRQFGNFGAPAPAAAAPAPAPAATEEDSSSSEEDSSSEE
ncbi:MAG: hypothetical protein CMK59_07575 [Proteobacteria bacterium]|nr:hypothetical protein [Pseudomonadota bacterium]